jgi:hypothetical protein
MSEEQKGGKKMKRRVHALVAVGMLGGLLAGLPAQPASAEARCDRAGVVHRHWHAAHNHWHTWVSLGPDRNGVYVAVMDEEDRHVTAIC